MELLGRRSIFQYIISLREYPDLVGSRRRLNRFYMLLVVVALCCYTIFEFYESTMNTNDLLARLAYKNSA